MMKKVLSSILTIFLASFSLHAQNLQVLDDTLSFSSTDELTAISLPIEIYNPGPAVLEVLDIDFFKIYGDAPFTLSDTAFVVQPQDTERVQLSFLPEHNILHNMALVIKTNSGFGHLAVVLTGQGTYTKTYYSTSQNKSEAALKTALKAKITQGYNSLGYNGARDNMFMSFDNQKTNGQGATVNTLECVYTGTVITGYSSRSAAQNGSPQFNTEHTFPQGMFSSNEPMRSDIHHLFPTTNTSNSQRGNDPFGIVTNATWTQGGSRKGNGNFEPRDVQKGTTARAMMYFVLRYQDYSSFFRNQETVLRNWHNQYPPDSADIIRNDDIFSVQNNRNPFVDYPQLAERIASLVTSAAPVSVQNLYVSDDSIKLAQGSGRYTYDYVLYNDGNTALNFSNFSLSDTSLRFVGGSPGSLILEPQSHQLIPISFNSAIAYQATLDYTVDVSGSTTITTPIGVGRSISVDEFRSGELNFYPNPADEHITLTLSPSEVDEVSLSSLSGGTIKLFVNENGEIDLNQVAPGFYIVSVLTKSGKMSQAKVVVR